MIALGLVCLLLAAAVTIGMLVSGTSQEVIFENRMGELTTSPLWIFVAGVLVTLLTLLGLSFFGKGTRHRVARRKEMKRLRKVEQDHSQQAPPATGSAAEDVRSRDHADDSRDDNEHDSAVGHRQRGDERPVVELSADRSGQEQGDHPTAAPAAGTSVTLGEHRTDRSPSTGGASLDQPVQQHDH